MEGRANARWGSILILAFAVGLTGCHRPTTSESPEVVEDEMPEREDEMPGAAAQPGASEPEQEPCQEGTIADPQGNCADVDECLEGLDDCATNATCTNVPGTFSCQCEPGFEGDGKACQDVDECAEGLDDCDPDSRCVNSTGAFICEDGPGFYICDCAEGSDPDCVPGDDSAEGTTPNTAWRSYDRANEAFGSLQAGSSLRFCRGGAFEIPPRMRWVNTSCLATSPCVVTSYDPGSGGQNPRPIFWARGTTAFNLANRGNAEHEEGYTFHALDLRSVVSPEEQAGNGFFIHNDVDDIIIDDVSMDGFHVGVQVAGSNPCQSPECDGLNTGIILRRSTVTKSVKQGWLGGSDGSMILDNSFSFNGGSSILDHNIYVSRSSTGMVVRGNDLYRSSAGGEGSCRGVSLVVHGLHDGLIIEDNLVWDDRDTAENSCWGIAVTGGYSGFESFRNVAIRGNTVINVGSVPIAVSSCVDCVVENNVIIHESSLNLNAAIKARVYEGDEVMQNLAVRNNSIFVSGGGNVGIDISAEGSGHTVVSNAIHRLGEGTGWSCLRMALPDEAYAVIDNNLCSLPVGARWESSLPSLDPLLSWQSTGRGLNSLLDNPRFLAPSHPNWDLSITDPSSVVINAGHPQLSAAIDIEGVSRIAPDIGAFEVAP